MVQARYEKSVVLNGLIGWVVQAIYEKSTYSLVLNGGGKVGAMEIGYFPISEQWPLPLITGPPLNLQDHT